MSTPIRDARHGIEPEDRIGSRIRIQIYEVQSADEVEFLAGLGVDHIGSVVLLKKGWKDLRIQAVVDATRVHGVKSSLIFLFNAFRPVRDALDFYRPHIVHFCEDLWACDPSKLRAFSKMQERIRSEFPDVSIMRTLPVPAADVPNTEDPVLELARRFESTSDFFLLDTHVAPAPVQGYTGITGLPCDWHLAADVIRLVRIPVILAGGLGPENVFEAILKTRPEGVDSCTRTNARDASGKAIRFRKDRTRVRQFVDAVRRAENALSAEK